MTYLPGMERSKTEHIIADRAEHASRLGSLHLSGLPQTRVAGPSPSRLQHPQPTSQPTSTTADLDREAPRASCWSRGERFDFQDSTQRETAPRQAQGGLRETCRAWAVNGGMLTAQEGPDRGSLPKSASTKTRLCLSSFTARTGSVSEGSNSPRIRPRRLLSHDTGNGTPCLS